MNIELYAVKEIGTIDHDVFVVDSPPQIKEIRMVESYGFPGVKNSQATYEYGPPLPVFTSLFGEEKGEKIIIPKVLLEAPESLPKLGRCSRRTMLVPTEGGEMQSAGTVWTTHSDYHGVFVRRYRWAEFFSADSPDAEATLGQFIGFMNTDNDIVRSFLADRTHKRWIHPRGAELELHKLIDRYTNR